VAVNNGELVRICNGVICYRRKGCPPRTGEIEEPTMTTKNELLEKLAELEHQQ
jgi:hypothetical protein